MNEIKESKLATNRLFGAALLTLGIFGFLVIIHRLSYYVFEYDPKFNTFDYGKYNILSFFTVQSNIFVSLYLTLTALAILGNQKIKKFIFNPLIGALVTTYILVTGAVYCAGIPMGFTPPFKWDTTYHSLASFIQVFHHMIIPPFMIILWFFPLTNRKIEHKSVWYFIIYPLVYSIFSIIRGPIGVNHFYPYPFYKADFIWSLFCGTKPINTFGAYLLMLIVLIIGMLLFVGIARLIIIINDKMTSKMTSFEIED